MILKDFPTVDLRREIARLAEVKVGDLLALITRGIRSDGIYRWGGMLVRVQHVSPKRFKAWNYTIDKSTGRRIGKYYSSDIYIIAPPELLAAHEATKRAAEEQKRQEEEFDARPDVIAARTIRHASAEELVAALSLQELQSLARKITRLRENRNKEGAA